MIKEDMKNRSPVNLACTTGNMIYIDDKGLSLPAVLIRLGTEFSSCKEFRYLIQDNARNRYEVVRHALHLTTRQPTTLCGQNHQMPAVEISAVTESSISSPRHRRPPSFTDESILPLTDQLVTTGCHLYPTGRDI